MQIQERMYMALMMLNSDTVTGLTTTNLLNILIAAFNGGFIMNDMFDNFDWSIYDSKINMDELRKLASNSSSDSVYKKVKYGEYCVSVANLILTKSKAGAYMVKCRFDIINGDDIGRSIYMYQVVQYRFQIDICNHFLRSLHSNVDITFDNYEQYSDISKQIWLDIKDSKNYRLYYGCNASGYDVFNILEVTDSVF